MAISDLISTSFLFSVAIIIILIGGMFAYVNYRMSEQDHKLSSMLELVTTLTQELRSIKTHNQVDLVPDEEDNSKNEIHIFNNSLLSKGPDLNLIEVSDDDSEEEDDDSVSNDSVSDDSVSDDSISNDSVSNDSEDDSSEPDLDEEEQIQTLNLGDFVEEEMKLSDDKDNIKSIHLEEPIDLQTTFLSPPSDSINDLKTIIISEIDATDIDVSDDIKNSKPDFKKMNLNKLREVVVEKNLVQDASKLKKNELLKLLGEKE